MAAPPPDTAFQKSDFPATGLGSLGVLDKLFLPLNSFMKSVRIALNGALRFSDNFDAEVKVISLTTPSTGAGILSCFPLNVTTKVKQPRGVLLMACLDKSSTPGVPSLGNPSWILNSDNSVRITNIPGLLLGRSYSITLLISAG